MFLLKSAELDLVLSLACSQLPKHVIFFLKFAWPRITGACDLCKRTHLYEDKDQNRNKIICPRYWIFICQTKQVHDGWTHSQDALYFVSGGLISTYCADFRLCRWPWCLPEIYLGKKPQHTASSCLSKLLLCTTEDRKYQRPAGRSKAPEKREALSEGGYFTLPMKVASCCVLIKKLQGASTLPATNIMTLYLPRLPQPTGSLTVELYVSVFHISSFTNTHHAEWHSARTELRTRKAANIQPLTDFLAHQPPFRYLINHEKSESTGQIHRSVKVPLMLASSES